MFRMRRLPRAALALALVPLAGMVVACGGEEASASADAPAGQSFTLKVYDPGNSGAIAVGKRDGDFDTGIQLQPQTVQHG